MDIILKNPAPHVDFSQILEKLEHFLINGVGLKCFRANNEATGQFTTLQAVGQVSTKPASQTSIPQNLSQMEPEEKVPLMIQAVFFPDVQTEEFLLSFRGAPNKHVVAELLNFIKFFMGV